MTKNIDDYKDQRPIKFRSHTIWPRIRPNEPVDLHLWRRFFNEILWRRDGIFEIRCDDNINFSVAVEDMKERFGIELVETSRKETTKGLIVECERR